jgi:S-formylglutathione hydrolase
MVERSELETALVPGPVGYATLRPRSAPDPDLPILLWLHGGGGSSRFLETCRPHFSACWNDGGLPDLAVVTPSAGWSFYLDRYDGSERWETFLFDELVPHIRKQTGSTSGPLAVGGISVGGAAALRMAFRRPEQVRAVIALEPTIEASLEPGAVPLRDRVHLPEGIRKRLYGDPIDVDHWQANHPPSLALANGAAITASKQDIYLDCGDADLLHAQYGTELLHRHLFDAGISHEYRLVRGANHVGPTVGPRMVDALRFLGRVLQRPDFDDAAIDAMVEVETFADQVRQLETSVGYRRRQDVRGPDCKLTVLVQGEGPRVLLLPSLGRGGGDFSDLADRLAKAGYRALSPEPRGIGSSSRALDGLTLDDFADDVAAVIDAFGGPATLIGHDFGGQVAQMVAYLYPDLVTSLVLLATPGPVQPKPEPATALRRVFIPDLSAEEHLEAVALALFAPGNDPVAWVDGWYPMVAFAQAEAERHVPIEDLWAKLRTDALVIQPSEDQIVLPENARLMRRRLGDLVSLVEIPGAGHALLPEQPEAVATSILSWLGAHR